MEPLADIRLLDPDGKDLDKLVGFTNAAKLTPRCRAALDRLAGKSGTEDKPGSAFKNKPVEPKPEAVDAAVKKAIGYLTSAFRSGWMAADGFSPDDLVLFAWAGAGVDPKTDDVVKLRDRVLATKLAGTDQAALRALPRWIGDWRGTTARLSCGIRSRRWRPVWGEKTPRSRSGRSRRGSMRC